jgi:hypothetical protein
MPNVTQISLGSATIQTEHEPTGDWEHVMLSLLDHLHETTFFWDLEFQSTTLNSHVKRKEINEKQSWENEATKWLQKQIRRPFCFPLISDGC